MLYLLGELLADTILPPPAGVPFASWAYWLGNMPLVVLISGLAAFLWYRVLGFRAVKVTSPDAIASLRKPWYKGMVVAAVLAVVFDLIGLAMVQLLFDTRALFGGVGAMLAAAGFAILVYWLACAYARALLPARARYIAGHLPRR